MSFDIIRKLSTDRPILGASSDEDGSNMTLRDPRPQMKSTGVFAGKTEFDLTTLHSKPLKIEAPLRCFMEAACTLTDPQFLENHRILKISDPLLTALRRISPSSSLLGGCSKEPARRSPVLENSPFAKRRNAWVKRLTPYFRSEDLIELHLVVKKIIEELPTRHWKLPQHHQNFESDGGWPIYILKVHQLILACLKNKNNADEEEAVAEKKNNHQKTNSKCSIHSNCFETRSLWVAANKAVNEHLKREEGETHGYGADLYRAYHRSISKMGSGVKSKVDDHYNDDSVVSTAPPEFCGDTITTTTTNATTTRAASTAAPQTSLEGEGNREALIRAKSTDNKTASILSSPTEDKEEELYVILMERSSDYQELGFADSSAYMEARVHAPINKDGSSEPVVMVYTNENLHRTLICLDLDIISFAINASGRYDAYLWALFIVTVQPNVERMRGYKISVPSIFTNSAEMLQRRAVHGLRVFRDCLLEERWSVAKIEYLSHKLMSTTQLAAEDTLSELMGHVWHAAFHRKDDQGLRRLEGLLVALMGHADEQIRSRAAVLLNMFYDKHDWQSQVPFVPVIKQVGDSFEVTVCLDDVADSKKNESPEGVFLILSAPSFDADSPYDVYSYHEIDWLPNENVKGRIAGLPRAQPQIFGKKSALSTRHRWIGTVRFVNFPRCGFYDWRVVRMNADYGSWEAIQAALNDFRRSASSTRLLDLQISSSPAEDEDIQHVGHVEEQRIVGKVYPHPQRMAEVLRGLLTPHTLPTHYTDDYQTFPLQGRFIVQARGVSDEQVHEIFIDEHGCQFGNTGEIRQRGTFDSVTTSLSNLRDKGVTMVYLAGALSRDNGGMRFHSEGGIGYEKEDASPFAVTCRCTPNLMSGGVFGLQNLIKEADRVGIKIVLDSFSRIASSHPHRKYVSHLLYYIDEDGKKAVLYGSRGRGSHFEDTCQLNYRKLESWELMIKDMKHLVKTYSIGGLRLENCQSWPPLFQADMNELNRQDPDKTSHYTVIEQMLAEVVLPLTEDKCGFWGSKAAKHWANPFLVKLCKEIWRECPEFVLIGECFHNVEEGDDQQAVIARSGVIPQLQDMPMSLARLFGHHIHKEDSSVVPCPPATVEEIIKWFDQAHADLPEGAFVIQSSCSHLSPLPALLYGRGAWPAVDLLFFLPDIPSSFAGEMDGRCFRLDMTNVYVSTSSAAAAAASDSPTTHHGLKQKSTTRSVVNLLEMSSPKSEQTNPQTSPFGPKPLAACRGLSKYEPVSALTFLEEEQVKKVGPEFGFDLKQICGHYLHRRSLRHRLKILRHGILVPLQARRDNRWLSRVFSFLRFDPEIGEFLLIGINFSGEELDDVSVSLKALNSQFRDMGMESTTTFMALDIFDILDKDAAAEDREVSKLHKIGSHRELGEIALMGGQNTLETVFRFSQTMNEVYSMAELLYKPQTFKLKPYGSICFGFKPVNSSDLTHDIVARLYRSSLLRLEAIVRSSMAHTIVRKESIPSPLEKILRHNFIIEALTASIYESGLSRFTSVLVNMRKAIKATMGGGNVDKKRPLTFHDLIVDSGIFCSDAQRFDPDTWIHLCSREGGGAAALLTKKDERTDLAERLIAKLMAVSRKIGDSENHTLQGIKQFADEFITSNNIGPIVFITTELGKWSTVGGLGVMVDELSYTLAEHLGQTVYVVTPYYSYDRKGQAAKLDPNELQYKRNIAVTIGNEPVELGVHEGKVRGVNMIFLHNSHYFPHPYPNWNAADALKFLSVIGKASLEVLCQKRLLPQLIVTNDWPTGLVSAYGKNPHFFGDSFSGTTFIHIVHNLDANYEGRIYAERGSNLNWITELSNHLLVDPTWSQYLYNPSRCALLCSDAWGTVSPSYRDELRRPGGSALGPLLNRYPFPFAYPNGVPLVPRLKRLSELKYRTHEGAKAELQRKYFGFEEPDLSIPLFAFIGRITEQKGVHHIVDASEQLIQRYQCKIQILVGGKVTWSDPYSAYCGHKMEYLRRKYPYSFWAAPDEFFSDGPLVNVGADVALMPSKFEPGGIVQHEFFIAGTPVLAFKTGGLRDTVYEFNLENQTGNGFTFEAYHMGDFLYAMERAWRVVHDSVKYAKLRENSKYSVISCEQVAQAWLIEFCRLRRKLPVNYGRLDDLAEHYASEWDPTEWLKTNQTFAASVHTIVEPPRTTQKSNKSPKDNNNEPKGSSSSSSSSNENLSNDDKDPLIPVKFRFVPKGNSRPKSVGIAGSFDNWQIRRPMGWDLSLQVFSVNMACKRGRYEYKYVVDGDWTLDTDSLIEKNKHGIANNILVVE